MTNNDWKQIIGGDSVVNRFQKMYLCYDEQPQVCNCGMTIVVNRFQKMYLCYDEQPIGYIEHEGVRCESLSKNVSLL